MPVEENAVRRDDETEVINPRRETLNYQLDLLKREVDHIHRIFTHTDQIIQTMKNWAVLIWAGSIAIALGQPDLRKYIILTAVLPLLFWFMDAHWKNLQRRSSFRSQKISQFLNDGRLAKSFEEERLVDFSVYDLVGRQYRNDEDYREYVSFRRAFVITEVRNFYLGLILISLVFGMFFLLLP